MEGIRFDEGYSIIESLLDKPKKQVWRVEDKTNRQECIVKKAFYDVKIDNKGLQEVITSSQLSHPNIVNYLGSWTEIHTPEMTGALTNQICLFLSLEYCDSGNLTSWLSEHRRTTQFETLMDMLTQLAMGVSHIHSKNIMHRSLKPSSIYVKSRNNGWDVKIGNFGYSKKIVGEEGSMEVDHTKDVGMLLYRSPEMKSGEDYNQSTDIYSMGLIYFEMLHGVAESEKNQIFNNISQGIFPDAFLKTYADQEKLIKNMLAQKAADRYKIDNILLELLSQCKRNKPQFMDIVNQLIQNERN